MKANFFFWLGAFTLSGFSSCIKNSPSVLAGVVQIHYIDASGKDLFPNAARGFNMDSVRLFDLGSTPPSLIYKAGFALPYVYKFQNYGAGNVLEIPDDFSQNVSNNSISCIIRLKNGVEDTLVGHYRSGTKVFDQIWYNGVIKLDTFTIRK